MALRYLHNIRPLIAILAASITVVALACGGDAATPTSLPTSTTPAPTATSAVPAATAPSVLGQATATTVPDVAVDHRDDWINYLKTQRLQGRVGAATVRWDNQDS